MQSAVRMRAALQNSIRFMHPFPLFLGPQPKHPNFNIFTYLRVQYKQKNRNHRPWKTWQTGKVCSQGMGTQQSLIRGISAPRFQTLPFLYTIFWQIK